MIGKNLRKKERFSEPDVRLWASEGGNQTIDTFNEQMPLVKRILSDNDVKSADVLPALPYLSYTPRADKQYSLFVESTQADAKILGRQAGYIKHAIYKMMGLSGDIHSRTPELSKRIAHHQLKQCYLSMEMGM